MSLGDLYGFVIFDCGITPEYFLDEMSSEEVGYLSHSFIKSYREKWEMLRMNNHAIISSQASKKVKLTDIMSFAWDEADDKVGAMNEEDAILERDRIRKRFNL